MQNVLIYQLLMLSFVLGLDGQLSKTLFRKDYTYLSPSKGFYKLHFSGLTWAEAKNRCASEGASLFYPENEYEANTVIEFWNQIGKETGYFIFIGISDLLTEGVFLTIDGRPILDVYSKWHSGEPNDYRGVEDCVTLLRDGTLNDYPCNETMSFICKKPLDDLESGNDCNIPRTGFQKIRDKNENGQKHAGGTKIGYRPNTNFSKNSYDVSEAGKKKTS